MIIVRLLSPGPWLVATTKVYSGVGADIVMESIALTTGRDSQLVQTPVAVEKLFLGNFNSEIRS
jgi:hypothetical protein